MGRHLCKSRFVHRAQVFLAFVPNWALAQGFNGFYLNEFVRDHCQPFIDQCSRIEHITITVNTNAIPCCATPRKHARATCPPMHAGPYTDNPLEWKAPAIGRMAPFLLFQCIFYWCVLAFIEADMFTGVRVRISTMFVRVKSMCGLCCRAVLPRRKVQPANDDTRTHQKSISGIDDEDIVCDYRRLMK
jgi:hypothetical protein